MGICKDRVSCKATLVSALLLLVIHVTDGLADDSALPVRSQDTLFKVEGKVAVPDHLGFKDWLLETRILFNYGQYVAYLRRDGSWEAHVPTGSYVVEAASKDLLFEPLRLDVSSRGKARARRLQLLQPGAVNGVPYPLKMKARMPAKYFQPPGDDDCLQQKLRDEARSLFLQKKSKELLDNEDLKKVWNVIDENHTPPVVDDVKMVGYENYKKIREQVPEKAASMLTATLFAKLQQKDAYGRISASDLFSYVMRKTWLTQSRIGLSLYDMTGQGYLCEKDLELYVSELMPTLPDLAKLEKSIQSFYVCTAVRRFLFFLDPLRQGRIKILHVLASGFLDDLLEDYKSYLDFVLAMENKKDPSALRYFFRILDINHRGYIDAFVINYFFRDIRRMIEDNDEEYVTFEDVKDEIFDMVRPKDPLRITLTDLVESGQGDTVVDILTDFNGFMTYENREMLATEDESDEETSEEEETPRDGDGRSKEAPC